jgi:hypothetical protein
MYVMVFVYMTFLACSVLNLFNARAVRPFFPPHSSRLRNRSEVLNGFGESRCNRQQSMCTIAHVAIPKRIEEVKRLQYAPWCLAIGCKVASTALIFASVWIKLKRQQKLINKNLPFLKAKSLVETRCKLHIKTYFSKFEGKGNIHIF